MVRLGPCYSIEILTTGYYTVQCYIIYSHKQMLVRSTMKTADVGIQPTKTKFCKLSVNKQSVIVNIGTEQSGS